MSFLIKTITGIAACIIAFNFMGVTIDENGFNADNSIFVKEAKQSANCIENFTQCMKNPPSNPWD